MSADPRNGLDLQFQKRSLTQPPFGPSVSGGSQRGSGYPITSMLSNMMSGKVAPGRPKAFSDDSYDSSSSLEDKSVGSPKWKSAMDIVRGRKAFTEDKMPPFPTSKQLSAWERTKKVSSEEAKNSQPGKKKSKRHHSLDAKTARFYAKRQQTGWTEGRQLGASSSDDESGLRLRREASPRRKRGSKENSSLSSKTPSRDPSVAPSPRAVRSNRPDLPPSSNGVAKTNTKAINRDVPVIHISAAEASPTTPLNPSTTSQSHLTKSPSIEDWINSRSLLNSDKIKGVSSSNLSSVSAKEQLFPSIATQPAASNLPWNQVKSRRSLPVGIDDRILGASRDVVNRRHLFQAVSEVPEPTSSTRYYSVSSLSQKPQANPLDQYSSRKRLLVVPEHGKVGASVNNVLSEKINASSKLGFPKIAKLSELRSPSRSGKVHSTENPYAEVQPRLLSPMTQIEPVQKWNSDWQLHQSSSGVNQSYRPASISAFDPNRLGVPSRLAPLKEINHLELERALEELDEFYESLSTKSEEHTHKSSNSNNRSDSGLSSTPHKEEHIYAEPIKGHSNRLEYTRDWVQYDGSNQLQNGRKVASMMALNQQHNHNLSPYRRVEQAKASSMASWNSNVDVRKDDYAHRKPDCKQPPKKASDLPNPSYLLMSVAYTPTVFTGSQLEFQNYPGSNRPEPHREWDDLSARKIIHAQNTPSYKVTADLSKQIPSSRNDYATPESKEHVSKFEQRTKRPKEPDTIRDDVAYRQLRNEKNTKSVALTTVMPVKEEKTAGPKTRWISTSIRNLAKQFESPKSEPAKSVVPRKTSGSENIMAAMQINGKKFSLRPSNLDAPTKSLKIGQEVSPKISPMNEQQMDDLLLSLHAAPSPVSKPERRKEFGFRKDSDRKNDQFDKITRFAVIV